ncbi:hypothetical protein ES703_78215 [subsurface metagenome]
MNKKLLIGVIVVAVVASLVAIVLWRSGSSAKEYMENVQPILQSAEILDLDIYRSIHSETTISTQEEQISIAENEARELRGSLASTVPPSRFKDAHGALLTAASARLEILTHFGDFLTHLMLIEADELLDHINKAAEYYEMAIATGLQRYADLAQAEIAKANELIDDNRKWIGYAEGDLADCDEAIQEYLVAFQRANTELSMQLTSKIAEINLSPFRQGIAEAKQLNDDLADAMSK